MLITLARKPLVGSVVQNVLAHGVGSLNVDATRIGTEGGTARSGQAPYPRKPDGTEDRSVGWARTGHDITLLSAGRWPANVLLHGDEVLAGFPSTVSTARNTNTCTPNGKGMFAGGSYEGNTYQDSGSAARFFKQIGKDNTP